MLTTMILRRRKTPKNADKSEEQAHHETSKSGPHERHTTEHEHTEAEDLLRDMFGGRDFTDSMARYRRGMERIRKILLVILPIRFRLLYWECRN